MLEKALARFPQAVLQQGRRFYPDDAQLLFQEALRRREQGDLTGAEACLLRLLNGQEGPHFASVAEGLRMVRSPGWVWPPELYRHPVGANR